MPNSHLADLPRPVAIVCHDAGAANQIFAWLEDALTSDPSLHFYLRLALDGPAARIWTSGAFSGRVPVSDLECVLDGAGSLVSGTGWQSDLEHLARKQAKAKGLRCVAVLDHWVNYEDRFIRDGEKVLPDELWVSNEYAVRLAASTFPGLKISQLPDTYLEHQVRRILEPRRAPPELLYLLEPARSTWGKNEPGEFQALAYLIERWPDLGVPRDTVLTLRPHPSDEPGKYDRWIMSHANWNARLDQERDLHAAISRSTWVAGTESFALVIALHAGRKVYCTLPPWAPDCRLPHRDLIMLKNRGSDHEVL